jgi:multidrug efflux system membrane fusion protein
MATADGNDAVVASGLTPGMQVVATGVHVLSPGQKVTVYQPKTAVAPVNQSADSYQFSSYSAAGCRICSGCGLFRKVRHT